MSDIRQGGQGEYSLKGRVAVVTGGSSIVVDSGRHLQGVVRLNGSGSNSKRVFRQGRSTP